MGEGSFFKVRRCVDMDDLQMQLRAWHEEVNEQRPSRATGHIPGEVLRAEELGRLRPVKLHPDQLDLRFPVRVGPSGMVTFQTHRYSMPAEALAYSATLLQYRGRVIIEAGRYLAEHSRLRGRNRVSRLAAHRAGLLAAVSGKRGRMYLQRQRLLELGRDAERVLTELVHVRPRPDPSPPAAVDRRPSGPDEPAALKAYTQPAVVVCDELGCLSYDPDAAKVLYHLVTARCVQQRSLLFTTNKPFKDRGGALHYYDLAEAIIDRVLERGRSVALEGPSVRTRHLGGIDYEC